MSKRIKITESQLKMLMERRHTYSRIETKEEEEECKECGQSMEEYDIETGPETMDENNDEVINEQLEKIRSEFKRFL